MPAESSYRVSLEWEDLAPYTGRWVTIAEGKIAGVGETALAAERMGRRNRIREKLETYFVERPGSDLLEMPDQLEDLLPIFKHHDQPVYLVGGAVRDLLLNRRGHDLDFVVPHGAINLAFKVAEHLDVPAFILDRDRDTARVLISGNDITLDFSSFRAPDILSDLQERDFTINAMALPVAARHRSSLLDPCAGARDIHSRVIRYTHDKSISDDPVRAIRAIRLAVDLRFTLDIQTSHAVRAHAGELASVSIERVRDELLTMIGGRRPDQAIRGLQAHDLLPFVLPEIANLKGLVQSAPHNEPVLDHTIRVLASLGGIENVLFHGVQPRGPALTLVQSRIGKYREPLQEYLAQPIHGRTDVKHMLRLAALFHDAGKAETASQDADGRIRFINHENIGAAIAARRLRQLRLSNEAVNHVRKIVKGHMWPLHLARNEKVSRRAVYRYFRRSGRAGVDIGLLSMADHLATYGGMGSKELWERHLSVVDELFDHYFYHYDETIRPEPLINGSQLMAAVGIDPGPGVGHLLEILEEAQAAGEIKSRQEAIDLASREVNRFKVGEDTTDRSRE